MKSIPLGPSSRQGMSLPRSQRTKDSYGYYILQKRCSFKLNLIPLKFFTRINALLTHLLALSKNSLNWKLISKFAKRTKRHLRKYKTETVFGETNKKEGRNCQKIEGLKGQNLDTKRNQFGFC